MRPLLATSLLPLLLVAAAGCSRPSASAPPPPPASPASPLHEVALVDIDGRSTSLGAYRGKVLLIVNTASRCGFTPQYKGLEALRQRYLERGFEVLAFPSNDFLGQEPGTEAEIKTFCEVNFNTTFPLFSKVKTRGEGQHPLYALLTSTPGYEGAVGWNFTKFLVDPSGRVIGRFDSRTDPLAPELTQRIESALP